MDVAVKAMLPQKLQEHYIADNKNKITNQMNGCGHTEIYILYICTVSVLSLQLLHTKLCMIVVQHSGIKITT